MHIDHTSASVGRTRLSSCGILHICTVSALGPRDSRWQRPTQSFDLGPPSTVKPWSSRCREIQDEQSAYLSPHDGPTLGMMFRCHVAPIGGPCQAAYLAWFLRTKPKSQPPLTPILRPFFLPSLHRSISAQYAATRPGPCHATRRRGGRLESRFLNVAFVSHTPMLVRSANLTISSRGVPWG